MGDSPPIQGTACKVKGSVGGGWSTAGPLYCDGATWIKPAVGAACIGAGTAEGFTCSAAGFWIASAQPSAGGVCTEAGNTAALGTLYCNGATWVRPAMNNACVGEGTAGGFTCTTGWRGSLVKEQTTIGSLVVTLLNISTIKSDFTYPNWSDWNGCGDVGGTISLQYKVESSDSKPGMCSLRPDTTYYINLRNEDTNQRGIDTCPVGQTCGFLFQMH